MTAPRYEIGGAGSTIAVELSMDDAELAERVRMMIIEWPDIEVIDAEDRRTPQVQITDGAVEPAPNVPVLVLTDASGLTEALQAGASAVVSESADGDSLRTAIRAAAHGFTVVSEEFRVHLVDASGPRSAVESDGEDAPPAIDLTARELQVLRLLAEGASTNPLLAALA